MMRAVMAPTLFAAPFARMERRSRCAGSRKRELTDSADDDCVGLARSPLWWTVGVPTKEDTMFERRCALVAGVAAVVLAGSGAAQAKTYRVSGEQVIDDAAAGRAHMTGGLVGRWTITSFKETAKTPLIGARGGERFTGCIDRARDGSCAGDPTG